MSSNLHYDPAIQHVSEYIINVGLEYCGTVGKPERHNEGLIVTGGCGESSLPLILLSYANEVVCAAKVEFSEVFSLT